MYESDDPYPLETDAHLEAGLNLPVIIIPVFITYMLVVGIELKTHIIL